MTIIYNIEQSIGASGYENIFIGDMIPEIITDVLSRNLDLSDYVVYIKTETNGFYYIFRSIYRYDIYIILLRSLNNFKNMLEDSSDRELIDEVVQTYNFIYNIQYYADNDDTENTDEDDIIFQLYNESLAEQGASRTTSKPELWTSDTIDTEKTCLICQYEFQPESTGISHTCHAFICDECCCTCIDRNGAMIICPQCRDI